MSSSVRRVVVDDNDSRIVYSDSWFLDNTGVKNQVGNFGPALRSTLHGTNSSGSLQFEFSGTSVDVYGTTDIRNSSGIIDPSWDCFVDNVKIESTPPFRYPENNWRLCGAHDLADAAHTLTVNANIRERTFWFDYVQYIPSKSSSLDDALVSIGDRDSSLQYDPHWEQLGDIGTMTSAEGSTMTFNFTGVSVAWYGIYPSERPITPSLASYSVDGGDEIGFALKGLSPGSVTVYNQMMFQTDTLPSGPHAITVKFLSDQKSTPLTLDYLLVQNGKAPLQPSASSPSLPSSSTTTSPVSASGHARVNVVGVVLGVLAAVLLLLIIAFLVIRRRKIKAQAVARRPIPSVFPMSLGTESVSTSSPASLHGFGASIPRATNYTETTHRRRTSVPRADPQQGGSKDKLSQAPSFSDVDEHMSYYGGYQTWRGTKELEAAANAPNRASYL